MEFSFWGSRILLRPADYHPEIRSNALTKSSRDRSYASIPKTASATGKFNSQPSVSNTEDTMTGTTILLPQGRSSLVAAAGVPKWPF